jgi:hypothetical protein
LHWKKTKGSWTFMQLEIVTEEESQHWKNYKKTLQEKWDRLQVNKKKNKNKCVGLLVVQFNDNTEEEICETSGYIGPTSDPDL